MSRGPERSFVFFFCPSCLRTVGSAAGRPEPYWLERVESVAGHRRTWVQIGPRANLGQRGGVAGLGPGPTVDARLLERNRQWTPFTDE